MTTERKILAIVLASCLGLLTILVAFPRICSAVKQARMEKAREEMTRLAAERFSSILTDREGSGCYNLIILDESGSMKGLEDSTLMGANETIASIKAADDTIPALNQYISLVTFSGKNYGDTLHVLNYLTPIKAVKELMSKDYNPDGSTPLYDAIGDMLTRMAPEVPKDASGLVTIITDGLENSSRRFAREDIKGMIQVLEERGWTFTYIGANQDAVLEAGKIGVSNAMNYDASSEGIKKMMIRERRSRADYYVRLGSSRSTVDRRNAGLDYFNETK